MSIGRDAVYQGITHPLSVLMGEASRAGREATVNAGFALTVSQVVPRAQRQTPNGRLGRDTGLEGSAVTGLDRAVEADGHYHLPENKVAQIVVAHAPLAD